MLPLLQKVSATTETDSFLQKMAAQCISTTLLLQLLCVLTGSQGASAPAYIAQFAGERLQTWAVAFSLPGEPFAFKKHTFARTS